LTKLLANAPDEGCPAGNASDVPVDCQPLKLVRSGRGIRIAEGQKMAVSVIRVQDRKGDLPCFSREDDREQAQCDQ